MRARAATVDSITIYFFLTLDDFKHALAEEGRDNVKVCEEPVRKRHFA